MNTAVSLSPPEQLLALTQQMLASAQTNDWDTLVELEKTRLPLLNQVFAEGIVDKVELAKKILSIDEQTKSLAKAEMPVIQDELQKLKNSGKASSAYQTIQDFASK